VHFYYWKVTSNSIHSEALRRNAQIKSFIKLGACWPGLLSLWGIQCIKARHNGAAFKGWGESDTKKIYHQFSPPVQFLFGDVVCKRPLSSVFAIVIKRYPWGSQNLTPGVQTSCCFKASPISHSISRGICLKQTPKKWLLF